MQTFKSVLGNIIDEVAKKFGYNKEQLGKVVERGIGESNTGADVGTVLQEILAKLVKPQIVAGLDVTATAPPSLNVLISPGFGSAQGITCELKTPQNITVDTNLSIYYIILNGSKVSVSASLGTGLPLAKIVIPYPGVTNKILDDKNTESEYDGYIISGKDLLFNNNFIIDDESIAQLKNTMSKIFAEYIFGTIKLNESLQIANEQGTLRADSDSVNFYDVSGNELASYGAYEARVGNIKVTPSTIQSRDFQENAHGFRLKDNGDAEFNDIVARGTLSSPNFTPGFSGSGWQINRAGDATFNNGIFRGELHTCVFVKDSISATNGNLVVTNATVLSADVSATDTTISVKETVFNVGDRVRIQPDSSRSEYMSIDSVNGLTYGVTRDIDGSGANTFQAGDAIVGQGSRVEIIASGDIVANLPYIDVIKRNSSTWDDTTTKVRLGNLSGITDAQFGTLSDYGLYTNNGYFTGSITASNILGGIISGTIVHGMQVVSDSGIYLFDTNGYAAGRIFARRNTTTNDTEIAVTGPINILATGGYMVLTPCPYETPDVSVPLGGMLFYGSQGVYEDHLCLYTGSAWKLVAEMSTNGDMSIAATKKFYFDGGGDTYISEAVANELLVTTGGTAIFNMKAAGVEVPTGKKISLNAANTSYIVDTSNEMQFSPNNGVILTVKATGLEVPTGKFLAFNAANSVYLKEQSAGSLLAYSTTFYRSSNGSAFDTTSDIRLKENITPLPDMMDKILLLKPVTYDHKKDGKLGHIPGTRIGFTANDMQKVFPEWVETGSDGYLVLNMEGINAVLVKAIQEQQSRIDKLEAQVKTLMEKLQ
ncbi:MAG: tail fiber domain-containing protein [Candidatus Izemoplasmatales bacterium]